MYDNDAKTGGGAGADITDDDVYDALRERIVRGEFAVILAAPPCSTFSISRFFDASTSDGGDRGPPIVRDADHPDGLPESEIDPAHVKELRSSNLLLQRTVNLAIAARRSPRV